MTLPLLRVLWMQSAIAAHTPLIEKSKQINLPLPFDAAIIKKHDTIATLSLFNDCFDLLSTKDPRVVEYTSANGNVRAELVVDPTLFEKFHELSLRPLIWSFALSFEGEIPDGFTFEDMFYLSAPTRRVSLKMGQIAMVQQKLGQLELSANVLVDLLNFSRLPAPEYTSGANGTVCRLIACQTLNTFLMRLSPDDLPRVRPQLQEMQHALLADSFEVEKFGRVFPVVDLYRDKPAKAYGWLLEPLAIHLQNKEIHTLIEYKTRLKSKPPSTPDLPNPNWTRQGFMGDEDKQYIPYYDSYAAYVNATSIHIASRIFHSQQRQIPRKTRGPRFQIPPLHSPRLHRPYPGADADDRRPQYPRPKGHPLPPDHHPQNLPNRRPQRCPSPLRIGLLAPAQWQTPKQR